jgi:hypothetical protein
MEREEVRVMRMAVVLLAAASVLACEPAAPPVSVATTTMRSPAARSPSPAKKARRFHRYCVKTLAWGSADFDGDGLSDRLHFTRGAPDGRLSSTRWNVELTLATGESSVGHVKASCPSRIGRVDLDADGRDEYFYDTGSGMTAAMVDLMRFDGKVLRNIPHGLQDWFYVGNANSGSAKLRCLRDGSGVRVVTTDVVNPVPPKKLGPAIITTYLYDGRRLLSGEPVHSKRKPGTGGSLDCFGLHWDGY